MNSALRYLYILVLLQTRISTIYLTMTENKIFLLGAPKIGKSTFGHLVSAFYSSPYSEEYISTCAVLVHYIRRPGGACALWDVGGHYDVKELNTEDVGAVVLAYNPYSLYSCTFAEKNLDYVLKEMPNAKIVLAVFKYDLYEGSPSISSTFASYTIASILKKAGSECARFNVSSKTGHGVEEMAVYLATL